MLSSSAPLISSVERGGETDRKMAEEARQDLKLRLRFFFPITPKLEGS